MDINVNVLPTAVTVFPDRALVICEGSCEVQAGQHKLKITHLPLTLRPDSVRVSGSGTTLVKILSVDVSRQFFEEAPQKNVHDLEAEIERLHDSLRQVMDKKAGWDAHGRYLEGMRLATVAYAKGLAKGSTQVEDQIKIVAFLQEQDNLLRTAVQELDKEARTINKQLEKLKLDLGLLSQRKAKQLFQATVDIQVNAGGTFTPSLTYVVDHASWRPLYDVRLTTKNVEMPSITVTALAEISQRTGEAWEGVDLAVSTARPALTQRLPELNPWLIDQFRPPIPRRPMAASMPKVSRSLRHQSAMPEAEAAPAAEAPQIEAFDAEEVVAQVEDSGSAIRFIVAGGSDIPSDGSPHKTTIANYHLNPELDYLAVPKHTNSVYRRATTKNSSGTPWLAGEANLFVDEAYIGKTQIEFTAQNGELELLLGVEDRITIQRELVRRDVDKKMLSDMRRIRFGYQVDLQNLLSAAVNVAVKDHIPISKHEQIKVKMQKIEPAPKEVSDMNSMEWIIPMNPQEKSKISYEFTVEHPRSLEVKGLP